jgi:hypothetical protein
MQPRIAIGYAEHRSRSDDAVVRVYDDAGNVIETHDHKGEFNELWVYFIPPRAIASIACL